MIGPSIIGPMAPAPKHPNATETLRALAVWPRSAVDSYGEFLPPRFINNLYAASEALHEAADTIEELVERLRRLLDRHVADAVAYNPESETEVVSARATLAKIGGDA